MTLKHREKSVFVLFLRSKHPYNNIHLIKMILNLIDLYLYYTICICFFLVIFKFHALFKFIVHNFAFQSYVNMILMSKIKPN